jgi:uncharacterized protein (DUF58 family)
MANLKKLLIKARRGIFSEKVGNNPSIFKGEGYDFVELRNYQIGDDIRKIDWNITAKLHEPYVKLFQEERELNIVVVPILTGSTYFGSQKMKIDLIAEIVAILGYSTIKNMDNFSSFIFGGKGFISQKPSKKIFSIEKIVKDISDFDPVGKNFDPQFLLETLLKNVRRRSMIFVVSDFYTPIDFRYLSKHSEVVAIVVRDKFEENPPNFGYTTLVDGISGKRVEGDFSNLDEFKSRLGKFDEEQFSDMRRKGVKYAKIYTHQNPFKELRKLFK